MKKLDLKKADNNKNVLNRAELSKRAQKSRNNILEIIYADFRSAVANPLVVLVLFAVIILPSLYGLVNIYACWDPYENTGNVQFAIANEDNGSTYENYTINAGNDLVESLENNTDFDWVFVSSDELRQGVHDGKYYAGMIIPQDFSESIVSITSDHPKTAKLEYIVNQKTNPVAAKLTDSAAKAVYTKLNAEIVSFISVVAHGKMGELEEGLSSGAAEMKDGADQLSDGAKEVAAGADELTSGANQLSSGAYSLSSGASAVSEGATAVAIGSNELSGGADEVASGASQVADGTHQIATKVDDVADKIHRIIKVLNGSADEYTFTSTVDDLDTASNSILQELKQLDTDTASVNDDAYRLALRANNLSANASQLSARTDQVSNRTHQLYNDYETINSDIAELKAALGRNDTSRFKQLLQKIDSEVTNVSTKIDTLDYGAGEVAYGTQSVATGANELSSGAYKVADGAEQVSGGASTLASGVQILSDGTIKLATGAELLGNSAADALYTTSSSLYSVTDQLEPITGLEEDQVSDFFYEPVKLVKHEEFPVSNYGSQVAPFYLVLSMWVGALITCVMLKTGSSVGTKYRPHEMYMGKLVIFNIMAFLQTTVTLIGCYALGIDISNPLLFIFSCYFVSIVFMAMIYSFISVFGDVGKGIAILLLVFQISGSGGVYPIEIMNDIFGVIYPFLPMTHGINIVRESQLGLIWSNYLPSFAFLLVMGVVIVVLAILLKQRWDKRTKFFEDKLGESNLFK